MLQVFLFLILVLLMILHLQLLQVLLQVFLLVHHHDVLLLRLLLLDLLYIFLELQLLIEHEYLPYRDLKLFLNRVVILLFWRFLNLALILLPLFLLSVILQQNALIHFVHNLFYILIFLVTLLFLVVSWLLLLLLQLFHPLL